MARCRVMAGVVHVGQAPFRASHHGRARRFGIGRDERKEPFENGLTDVVGQQAGVKGAADYLSRYAL